MTTQTFTATAFAGLGVVVVGLAREGSAVARFFAERGARVTVTDAQPAAKLQAWIDSLAGLPIEFALGAHPDTLLNPRRTDVLVVSPGVPPHIPFLQRARQRKLLLTTESRILSQFSPAPVIGITGSSGKTTTTTLTGKMLAESGFTTHVGGNIGTPLISRLDDIRPGDRVVLELSSFQLEYFHAEMNADAHCPPELSPLKTGFSPHIGAILNITPNHLDRHKTMTAYTAAKRAIVAYIDAGDTAIFGWDDSGARAIGAETTRPAVRWFSAKNRVENGAFLADGQIVLVENGVHTPICRAEDIRLPGAHNRLNVLAAVAIARSAGATPAAMAKVATEFSGVPHRLEIVAERNGVTFINDSIATSPERLIAALKSFSAPIILLAGGKDKDLPWADAAKLMVERTKAVLLFGAAQDLIADAIAATEHRADMPPVEKCGSLAAAVARARQIARPGDIVLLSPGGTSYDAYHDFAARGKHFVELVNERIANDE